LEIVDPDKEDMTDVQRVNNFRPDFRVPKQFRADLSDFRRSGFDREYLVASANQNDQDIQNSETFLLSNMSPQHPGFNKRKWRDLGKAVRNLDSMSNVLEIYVLTGPIFDFESSIELIGERDENGIEVPVPSYFFKCILSEKKKRGFASDRRGVSRGAMPLS